MSYLLTYMMSGFNPFSVGGGVAQPQSLASMLGEGNIATENFLYDTDGITYVSVISSSINVNNAYPNIQSYSQGGFISLSDYDISATFVPYIKVGYYNGVQTNQVTIKPEGIEIFQDTKNTIKQEAIGSDKDAFSNQRLFLPTSSGQFQTQETPIKEYIFNSNANITNITPQTSQNCTFYISGVVNSPCNIILDSIPNSLRIYFVFNYSGGEMVNIVSDNDVYTTWGSYEVYNHESLSLIRYGNLFYIKKCTIQP